MSSVHPSQLSCLSDLKPVVFVGPRALGLGSLPSVQYGLFSEKIRQTAPKLVNCSVFCEGKKCKFEDPSNWSKDDMAINGVYSCWVTDDIVTMARPSKAIIEKYKIIKQFKELGIRSLINLQQRKEHGCCGVPLDKSGFAYDPQVFMENKIFYYNFDWKDYNSVNKHSLLDMVKVLSFAVSEGKVAVHSHSGLGRTGVLLACYLVYTMRCKPNDAMDYLRAKRSELILTKGQVQSVQAFAQFVVPMFIVFANVIPRDYNGDLNQYLRRQRNLLHGFEARLLKHIPKPVFMFCERLLCLADCHRLTTEDCPDEDIGDPNRFLGFFSSGRKLDIRLPSKYTKKKQWSLALKKTSEPKVKNNAEEQTVLVPNGTVRTEGIVLPPPPTRMSKTKSPANPGTSESSSSPGDSNNRSSTSDHVLDYRPLPEDEGSDDFLDMSDDEDMDLVPELLSSLPNLVPQEPILKSSKACQDNAKIIMNGGPRIKYEIQEKKVKIDTGRAIQNLEVTDANANDVINVTTKTINDRGGSKLFLQDEPLAQEDFDEDDDMNSEECNAIIDSVLKDTPSEEEISTIGKRRNDLGSSDTLDSREVLDVKGCPSSNINTMDIETKYSMPIVDAILADHHAKGENFAKRLRKYQKIINHRTTGWNKVSKERDPFILSALLWSWLEELQEPVLNKRDLSCIVIRSDRPLDVLQKLDFGTRYTTEYLVRFVAQLRPKTVALRNELLKRVLAGLTHQKTKICGIHLPTNTEWNNLRHGTSRELMLFVGILYDMVTAELPL